MSDFFYRTEDIRPDEVLSYFAETRRDREAIDALKSKNPTVIVGSRGVGKSFLLRVAEKELLNQFENERVFPVYLSFVRSSLVRSADKNSFTNWMLAKLCSSAVRALEKAGLLGSAPKSLKLIAGEAISAKIGETVVEKKAKEYEASYKNPSAKIEADKMPSVDDFREAFEDLSDELNIRRFVFLIDEAAHIFMPEQQRQFFTLFRDLRSHCLTCNAAVYPGVTSFGDVFQPSHDASMVYVDRDIAEPNYVENMKEIVRKQADSSIQKNIAKNGQNFGVLAYACSGNPRLLLKTVSAAPNLSSSEINDVVRSFYRSDIWMEHSNLAEKYVGHRQVIDWGRNFAESEVLPEIKSKNDKYLESDKNTSCYFWVHRDAPEIVKEALRILSYTGIVNEQESGMKATRGEVGKRYAVNLGCLFAMESSPASTAFKIATSLTPKRMTEFGKNHFAFKSLEKVGIEFNKEDLDEAFHLQLEKPIRLLDLTDWQKSKLLELNLETIGSVLEASEGKLKEAKFIGDVRARRMKNAATAAVLEYLSG